MKKELAVLAFNASISYGLWCIFIGRKLKHIVYIKLTVLTVLRKKKAIILKVTVPCKILLQEVLWL